MVVISCGLNDLSRYNKRAHVLADLVTRRFDECCRNNPNTTFVFNSILLTSYDWLNEEITEFNRIMFELSFQHSNMIFFDSHEILMNSPLIPGGVISGPTHNKGRTLDLMLTNSKNFVTEINVSPDCYLCKSDHYLLTFEVRSNVKRNKVPKRKILNFKKANWEALNNELGNIQWDSMLDCTEPELALLAFKHTLFSLVDRYIPSISIKSDFTSPWFDAECFEAYRNKDRAHKKFKNYSRIEGNTQNIIQSEINFKHKRQLFKNICSKKMRDNLYNEDDPGLITKKFWSHVKSNSKSSRLPETMHLDDTFRNKPSEKAELFNNYFYE